MKDIFAKILTVIIVIILVGILTIDLGLVTPKAISPILQFISLLSFAIGLTGIIFIVYHMVKRL
jgi:hypothetical protein